MRLLRFNRLFRRESEMTRILLHLNRFLQDTRGGMAEESAVMFLIVVATVAALGALGLKIAGVFDSVSGAI